MGTTLIVRDFRGTILHRGSVDMTGVVRAASQSGQLLLGTVDEYDDTVFNQLQSHRIVEELNVVETSSGDLDDALAELRAAVAIVQKRPHRYLVFNGD